MQAHRELAREAVRKSLVLLKNGKNETDPLVPLSKKASKILVAGTHADNLGYQCGGWTIAWQGFSGNSGTRGMILLINLQPLYLRELSFYSMRINELNAFFYHGRNHHPWCYKIHS